jgi:ABC-type transport system involved in multi-copper enzyme maturation permease subunit
MSAPTSPAVPAAMTLPAALGDWLILTLRLIRWDLFQVWRRPMTKALLGILLGLYAIVNAFILLVYAANTNAPRSLLDGIRSWLTFPLSVTVALDYTGFVGVVLLCLLAGALLGSEYGFGTQALALARGVGRGQALVAKVAALALLAAGTVGGMALLAVAMGLTVGPALGAAPVRLTSAGLTQLLAYWGAISLRLFVYSLIALFFATLGRSAAAGIGGALGFVAVEVVGLLVLSGIIAYQRGVALLQHTQPPAFANLLDAMRLVFLKTSADALVGAAQRGPLNLALFSITSQAQDRLIPSPSAAHALAVMLLWCGALVSLSYLLVRARDVAD